MFKKAVILSTILCAQFINTAGADDWNFVVAPYGLLPSISGDASIGRLDGVEVDVDPSDVLNSLDLGAMLQVEARHKSNFGVLLDYAFMDLGSSAQGPLGYTNVDADIFQGMLEGYGTYRIDFESSTLDTYAGVRWWHIGLDISTDTPLGSADYSRNKDWVDPVIGLRWMPRIADQFRLLLQGDVGGFGVASDFSWCAQGGVLWDASEGVSVAVLYKALGVDYQTGTRGTSSYFEYNTITQGPLFGLVFRL